MVKSLISAIISFLILIGGATIENVAIKKSFGEFNEKVTALREEVLNETATKQKALEVQDFWIKQKDVLHVIIPHNEIKEVDLWLSESCSLIETKMYDDALAKLEVVLELIEQIPKTFAFRVGNIM